MTDSTPWFTQLRDMLDRQRDDDDPTEQVSLGAQELLSTVPDHEICEAYLNMNQEPGGPLTDILANECERRNLDF